EEVPADVVEDIAAGLGELAVAGAFELQHEAGEPFKLRILLADELELLAEEGLEEVGDLRLESVVLHVARDRQQVDQEAAAGMLRVRGGVEAEDLAERAVLGALLQRGEAGGRFNGEANLLTLELVRGEGNAGGQGQQQAGQDVLSHDGNPQVG